MRPIYIVGAGGIGCAIGYGLLEAGTPVCFVESDPVKVDWGRVHGIRVDQRPARPATFEPFADWAPPPESLVILCTKCYDNPAVLARLPQRAALIPIQNGFDPLLAARGHRIEGIASFVSECPPGRTHTRITRRGSLHVGGRGQPAGVSHLGALSHTRLFRLRLVPDVLPYKYSKLMYNAAIGPLAAAAGLDNGQLLSLPQARRLFFALLRENHAILRNAGIWLGKVGPFHPETVQRILRRPAVANLLAWAFYPSLRGTYCSMSGDLPRGRTEIDFYNRHLIELAGDHPCPLNRRVYDLIRRMEAERLPPGRARLQELTAAPQPASVHALSERALSG